MTTEPQALPACPRGSVWSRILQRVELSCCVLSALVILMGNVCPADELRALVTDSCIGCHDNASREGDLSLENLDLKIDQQNAATWLRVLEQIEQGDMPPPDADQPAPQRRETAARTLEDRLVAFHSNQPSDRSTVLRRLNRTEYRNTIRDLLHLQFGSDLTSEFPGDQRIDGFASNGEALVTSSFLLRQYLEAAEEIVDQAVHFEPKPEQRQWTMQPPFDRTTGAEQGQAVAYYQKLKQPQPYQDICQRIGAGGAPYGQYHPLDDVSDQGVPVAGWYRIRIQAEAKFRHALKQELFKRWPSLWDEAEPIRLALFTATLQGIDPENKEARDFAAKHEQAGQRHIATWDLPDDEQVWLEARLWLEKGQFPRLGFPNGPTNSNYRMNTYFSDLAVSTLNEEELTEFEERKNKYGGWISFHFGESPRIRLYQITLEGPINELWPPQSHRVLFGDETYDSGQAEHVLRQFASRAWRRPVESSEVSPITKLVRTSESGGMGDQAAIQEGLKAILCSPEFLYREEQSGLLGNYDIASRLSYFLWASMPDERLLQRAAAGELNKPEVRREEAERMLADPRSDAFVDEFLDGWLQLRKLGSMAPDPHRFRVYYDDHLEPAMRTETRLNFRYLLETNGSITRFLDSDDTFVNQELADFYGIDRVKAAVDPDPRIERFLRQDGVGHSPSTRFSQVKLADRRRGGLLGQASILTLTANGVDTSPVIRGVWLLENILGTPPPPPPPDIPAIEPDIRGTTTIREQLQKHRESTACSSCHARIDPPGFALESFDPIGSWRGHYRLKDQHVPIDSTGEFDGNPFKDIVEFKTLLLKRQDLFARCVVEKLLVHALGRELDITDRPAIRTILESTRSAQYPLRDLVLHVVESPLLLTK